VLRHQDDGVPFYVYFSDSPSRARCAAPPPEAAAEAELSGETPATKADPLPLIRRNIEGAAKLLSLRPALVERLVVGGYKLPRFATRFAAAFGIGFDSGRDEFSYGGYRSDRYVTPERGGDGEIVGASTRLTAPRAGEDRKQFLAGGNRGLTYIPGLFAAVTPDALTVVFVEGASCAFAFAAAGVLVVGRPNNYAGAEAAAVLLARMPNAHVLVVAEQDYKTHKGGIWPGLVGSRSFARKLAALIGRPVRLALMPGQEKNGPPPAKDARDWFVARCNADTTEDEFRKLGRRLLGELFTRAVTVNPNTEITEPPFPARRMCTAAKLNQFAGTGEKAGRFATSRFPCRRRTCVRCGPAKAEQEYRHLVHCIRTAGDESHPDGDENPGPRPTAATHDKAHLIPRCRTFVANVPDHEWPIVRRHLRDLYCDYARITHLAGRADYPAACQRSLMGQQGDQTTLTALGTFVATDNLVILALSPEQEPPAGFVPVGCDEAIRLLGAALASVPTYSPDPTRSRFRPVMMSAGWRLPKREKSGWKLVGPSALGVEEVREAVSTAGLHTFPTAEVEDSEAAVVYAAAVPHGYVLGELQRPIPHRLPPTPHEVSHTARLWFDAIPAHQPVGPEFREYIAGRLWYGPNDDTPALLAEAATADRDQAEQERAAEEYRIELLTELFRGWDQIDPTGEGVTVRQVVKTADEGTRNLITCLTEVEACGDQARELSRLLKRYEGHTFGTLRVQRKRDRHTQIGSTRFVQWKTWICCDRRLEAAHVDPVARAEMRRRIRETIGL
jgi:hypothetical protein